MKKLSLFLLSLLFLTSFSRGALAETLSNLPNDWQTIGFNWQASGSLVNSFGQVIIPTDSQLNMTDITLFGVSVAPGTDSYPFSADFYKWDATGRFVVGPSLYQSNTFLIPNQSVISPADRAFKVDTPGLSFAPGNQYIMVLTPNSNRYANFYGISCDNPGCGTVFINYSENLADLQQNPTSWDPLWGTMAFVANFGPSYIDTQASLTRQASSLRGVHNIASLISNFSNSNTYDCNLFDVKGMCISAGGRYSTIDNPSSNSSAAVVTLGYKVNSNIRIGGFLDQSVTNNNPTGIDISNKNPMMGAFAYWNQQADGLGYQVKLANAYQDKDLTTTRDVIGTSEAGRGTTSLNSRSYVGELSYAFMFKENTLVRPYFALRHTNIEQNAYTETGVDNPLTYGALNNRTTSALMGVKFKHALTPKANLIGSLGVEQDLHHKIDQLTATAAGIAGLTSENLSSNLHRTRPVASIGATYDIAKTQRLSGEVLVQQLPFQSTAGATAYFNYMIGF